MIREDEVKSLCQETARVGWVTEAEYKIDSGVSQVWPEWMRHHYHNMADMLILQSRKNLFWKITLLSPSFFYVHTTNGVYHKDWRILAGLPFITLFLPVYTIGIILDIMDRFTL